MSAAARGLQSGVVSLFPGGFLQLEPQHPPTLCVRAILGKQGLTFRVGPTTMVCVNRVQGVQILTGAGAPAGFRLQSQRHSEGSVVRMILTFDSTTTPKCILLSPELGKGPVLEVHSFGSSDKDEHWLRHTPLPKPIVVRPLPAAPKSLATPDQSMMMMMMKTETDTASSSSPAATLSLHNHFLDEVGYGGGPDSALGIVVSPNQRQALQQKMGGLFVCFPLKHRPTWISHNDKTGRLKVEDKGKRTQLQQTINKILRDDHRVHVSGSKTTTEKDQIAVLWLNLPRWWAEQRLKLSAPPPPTDPLSDGLALLQAL